MTRLVSVKLTCPPLHGFRNVTDIVVDAPEGYLRGWRLSIRGASVYLISPPGFANGKAANEWKVDGPVAVYEIPRVQCHFQWSTQDPAAVMKVRDSYDSEVFDTPAGRAERAKAAEAELEQATAPKGTGGKVAAK